VDEWQPTPLVDDPTEFDEGTLDSVPMIQGPNGLKVKIQPNGKSLTNLATPNWTGLIENDAMKQVAVATLKEYGVGTCGPSGFYGTIGEFFFLTCLFCFGLGRGSIHDIIQHYCTPQHAHTTPHHLLIEGLAIVRSPSRSQPASTGAPSAQQHSARTTVARSGVAFPSLTLRRPHEIRIRRSRLPRHRSSNRLLSILLGHLLCNPSIRKKR